MGRGYFTTTDNCVRISHLREMSGLGVEAKSRDMKISRGFGQWGGRRVTSFANFESA